MFDSETMQAIQLLQSGPEFDLQQVSMPIPDISSNELLIEVEYVALNDLDAKLARDGFNAWQYPHVLGVDAVGTVIKANKGVFPLPGTRVLFNSCLACEGLLKQYAVIPNHAVTILPDNVASEVAAVLPSAGMSTLIALSKLNLSSEEVMAIHCAGGDVGHFAIQYAKKKGVEVCALAPKSHHERLLSLGANYVFDPSEKDFAKQVEKQLGELQFDCILNTMGGDSLNWDLKHLRFAGRIACLSGFESIDSNLLIEKSPTIGVVSVTGAWLAKSLCAQQHLGLMSQTLLTDLAESDIRAPEVKVVEFSTSAIQNSLTALLEKVSAERFVVKVKA